MRDNARESDNNRCCSFYHSPCYYKGPGVYPCGYCTARHPNGSQRTARHNSNSYPDFNDRQRLANADLYSSDSFTVGNYHLVLGELANSFQSHLLGRNIPTGIEKLKLQIEISSLETNNQTQTIKR